ncbi:uncharacterized protein LOC110713828 [Chenopodium quinoa]|uniref:uncharacterized protein LOC110713828 n=1 Tax=Chenopodium quinoa TaxID=63459 RepID=UPI000B78A95A|nr:uncharacterized protein LOC110713828 [Chenopodium quinoa]
MPGDEGKSKVDLTFHLGSSDGPGNVITPIQLKGDNYDEWARAVRTALKAKRKFGFIDGTVVKPTESEKLEDWVVVQSMLVSWLSNTLDPIVRSTIGDYDDACLLWKNLKNRFCVVSGTRVCQLKRPLGECKQGSNEAVAVYFGRLSKIWDELTLYVSVPKCSCGACTCNIVAQVEKIREQDYVHHFLIGLDDAYASIRGQLLAQEPLPSVARAYQQLVQAEQLRGGETTRDNTRDNAVAFKLQYEPKVKTRDTSDKFCVHCNREGHDEATRFQLHGFPDWWGDRPRGGHGPGRGAAAGRGGRAGGRGRGTNSSVRANKTSGQAGSQGSSSAAPNSSDGAALAGVSAAQIQQLLDHLNSLKSKLHGPNEEEGDWSG